MLEWRRDSRLVLQETPWGLAPGPDFKTKVGVGFVAEALIRTRCTFQYSASAVTEISGTISEIY